MMPRQAAIVTDWVRSLVPSLSMMCLKRTLTVSSAMNSLAAISQFRCGHPGVANSNVVAAHQQQGYRKRLPSRDAPQDPIALILEQEE
jgi:hypothetical protein